MSRIIQNSILNGTAMAITSVLSLALVPILVRSYGLDTYGLIPLIRLLTPLGAIGLLALGLPSLATRAAGSGTPVQRSTEQSTLLAVSVILGAALSLGLLTLGWSTSASWLNVKASGQPAFAVGFYVLLGALPILFAGLLLTSALTGLGHFRALRLTEVAVFVVYFCLALVAVWNQAPIEIVLVGLLVCDCLRAAALGVYAHRVTLIRAGAILRPDWRWLAANIGDLRVLTVASLSGYARKYAPSTTITLLFGPAALGLYDAVERIPRAFKTLLGLVNTAVLPRTLALDSIANTNQLRSLIVRGTRLILFFMLPANICVMFYSAPLFNVWLGATFRYAAPLLILLMIQNIQEMMLSVFSTASLSRTSLMQRQNVINVLEIGCIVVLTLMLTPILAQTAVFWSVAFASTIGYLLRIEPFLTNYAVSREQWYSSGGKVLMGSVVGNGIIYVVAYAMQPSDPLMLLTAPLAVIVAATLTFLMWTHAERGDLAIVFGSLRKLVAR